MYKEIIEYLENKIKRCDEFGDMKKEKWAFQTTLKEVRKLSERQESSETPEQPNSKALHIADVSGRFSNSWNFAKYFEDTEQYKRLTEVQKVEKDRIFLTATKIYDWLVSLNAH